jgi:hypothetical protein
VNSVAGLSEGKRRELFSAPGVFDDPYLRTEIRLEVGPLAGCVPHAEYFIVPYAAEVFPNLFSSARCRVKAIKAERTFWEKVTILHREAFRAQKDKPQSRYSRHYYDLARMSISSVKPEALKDTDLLKKVVEFKQQFYPCAWAKYGLARPGQCDLCHLPMWKLYCGKIIKRCA